MPTAAAALAKFNSSESVGSCSRGCTAPDRLHWWGLKIGDDGCAQLANMIETQPNRPSLTNLLLGQNDIGDACMVTIARVANAGYFKKLRALGLSRNRVTNSGCEALAAAMANGGFPLLRDLYFSQQTSDLGDACVSSLGRALASPRGPRQLEKISAGDNPALTVDGFVALLESVRALPQGGYLGAPKLRELSARNISNLCAALTPAQRTRLLAALSGLANSGGRASLLRRRVHVVLKTPECSVLGDDPAWLTARARWVSAQHNEVRVTLS